MPAGKSPNNAFNLHKERMKSVFTDICGGYQLPNNIHHHFMNESIEYESSKPYFYWGRGAFGMRQLYSKGYINTKGKLAGRFREVDCWSANKHCLINNVRKYYTDGVRAIGAME